MPEPPEVEVARLQFAAARLQLRATELGFRTAALILIAAVLDRFV